MKKALLLTGLFLCATGAYAEEKSNTTVADGRRRNEEAYERSLEQTGWKSQNTAQNKKETSATHQTPAGTSQPKSS